MRRLSVTAALFVAPALASAQNLVVNPSFEAGYTGYAYTPAPNDSAEGIYANGKSGGLARTGTHFLLVDNDIGSFGPPQLFKLTQTIATTPGTPYLVQFWAYGAGGFLTSIFGGILGDGGAVSDDTYREYSAIVVATGTSSDFVLTGFNASGVTFVDDLSVTALSVTTTPEPATLALTLGGLAVLGAGAWRRQGAAV